MSPLSSKSGGAGPCCRAGAAEMFLALDPMAQAGRLLAGSRGGVLFTEAGRGQEAPRRGRLGRSAGEDHLRQEVLQHFKLGHHPTSASGAGCLTENLGSEHLFRLRHQSLRATSEVPSHNWITAPLHTSFSRTLGV